MHTLLCLVHFHAPVGTSHEFLEDYYQNICRKVLISFHNHQELKFCLHVSGIFLEWLDYRHPEILMLINDMVKRKQVELIGGPYYEAALSIIPNSDKIGQIELLTTYLRKSFGKRPRGGMVPHLIWEPSFASSLKNSGFDYSFVSASAVDGDHAFRPFLTEDQGKSIVLFPVSDELSAMIGAMRPSDLVRHLSAGEKRVYSIFLDTCKFHSNRGIFDDQGWFDDFLGLLSSMDRQIQTRHPGTIIRRYPILDRLYIPCTQPFNTVVENPGTAFFRQLISANPVSCNMYGKMLYAYQLVNQIKGDRSRKKTAREELWKGQCNEAYWAPGYLDNHVLRKTLYGSFMESEKIAREKGIFKPSISTADMNMDGRDEFLYQSQNLNCYIYPGSAAMYQIDYLPCLWNYGDTYCENASGKPLPGSFADCILDVLPKNNAELLNGMDILEYDMESVDKDQKELMFLAKQQLARKKNTSIGIHIKKQYQFKKNTIAINYFPATGDDPALFEKCFFISTLFLSFACAQGFSIRSVYEAGQTEIDILDTVNNVHIGIGISGKADYVFEDVFTTSKGDKNQDCYQYTKFALINPLQGLKPLHYSIKIEKR